MTNDDDKETKLLKLALSASLGDMAKLAENLGVSRQAVHKRVKKAGLLEVAAKLREKNNIRGARTALRRTAAEERGQKREIRAAVKKHRGNLSAAADQLGVNVWTLRKRMTKLGLLKAAT